MSETAIQKADFKRPAPNLSALKHMGASVQQAVADALPAFLRNRAGAMLRALYTECQKSPALLSCTAESLFACTIQAAQLGLDLGGPTGQAYLIPFKGRATLVVGYRGYIQLVNRSGQAGTISAYTVYDKDTFDVTIGTEEKIVHRPGCYDTVEKVRDRKAVAYYATCRTRHGTPFVTMTRAEAEYHRDRFALQKNRDGVVSGPWRDHFDAMALKTCIVKLCKFLPMSAELQMAVSLDASADAGEPVDASFLFAGGQDDGEAEALPPADKVDALRDRLKPTPRQAAAEPTPAGKTTLAALVEELAEAGGDGSVAAFFQKHNSTQDDLEHARGNSAARYANLLREAVDAAKGGGE